MRISETPKKALKILVLGFILAWAVIQHSRSVRLSKELAAAKGRAGQVGSLEDENRHLKAALATSGANRGQGSEKPNAELLRLRGEVGVLRRQVIEMSTNNAGSIAPARVTLDVSSPFNSLSNLFTAIHLADMNAVRQFLTPKSDLLRRVGLAEFAAVLEKVQSVSVYAATDLAFAVSDPLPDREGRSALLFEIRNVEGKWLLHKVHESDLSHIQERVQSLSQQQGMEQTMQP